MVTEEKIDEVMGRLADISEYADNMVNLLNKAKDKWNTKAGEEQLTAAQKQRIFEEYGTRKTILQGKMDALP